MPTLHLDLHVHSQASHDARGSVDDLLAHARTAGLDGFAVTDHDTMETARAAASRADDLLVLPGVEVSTAAGHLLAIGVAERPPTGAPFDETVARVRAAGGVAIVPHPGQRSRHGVRPARIDDADAVETYNAWRVTGLRNRRAGRFARRHDYPAVGGSDAHAPDSVGRAHTAVYVPSGAATPAGVLDALRTGHAEPRGDAIPLRRYVRRFAGCLGRKTSTAVPRALRMAVR